MLLSEGRTIFIGQASAANEWFASHGYVCPPSSSVADYFLDTISKVKPPSAHRGHHSAIHQ